METFTEPKEMVNNSHFQEQRQKSLSSLSNNMTDIPINGLINGFNIFHFCFTLQCCYGHFVYNGLKDIHNFEPLPISDTITKVEYRIAYIAFCIENSNLGRLLLDDLQRITSINPENIQFCSAEWFWKRQVNSYALQVEPERFKNKDKAILDYEEALYIEKIRNKFFIRLGELIKNVKER